MPVVFTAFLFFIPLLISQRAHQGYSEFYFQESRLEDATWRRTYGFADSIPLGVVIVNHEESATDYRVAVLADGVVISDSDLGLSNPGEMLTEVLVLPPSTNTATRYEFLLLRGDSLVPYRTLHVWIERTE
jgi:uncharacterized membrane protein